MIDIYKQERIYSVDAITIDVLICMIESFQNDAGCFCLLRFDKIIHAKQARPIIGGLYYVICSFYSFLCYML